MRSICVYKGSTPQDNAMCNRCPLFLETCIPVAGYDGYSFGECGCYLCEGCWKACEFKACISL